MSFWTSDVIMEAMGAHAQLVHEVCDKLDENLDTRRFCAP